MGGGFQDKVLIALNHRCFSGGKASPQHKHERRFTCSKTADDLIGELLPSFAAVRGRGTGPHR